MSEIRVRGAVEDATEEDVIEIGRLVVSQTGSPADLEEEREG